uniref:Uncharacterized protein n=1 Tax=Ditylenchus dipsaci TaxID=166011 RepID=A0A915DC03_9BILA
MALYLLRRAWRQVKPETVRKCFQKAGFVINEQEVEQVPEDNPDDDLNILWAELKAAGEAGGVELEDYIAADQNLVTGGLLTLKEIAASVSTTNVEEEDSDSDLAEIEEEEPEQPPVTNQELKKHLLAVQRYIQVNIAEPVVHELFEKNSATSWPMNVSYNLRKNLFRLSEENPRSSQLLQDTLILLNEQIAHSSHFISGIGCSCLKHLLLSAGPKFNHQQWSIVVWNVWKAVCLSLLPIRKLISQFFSDSTDFCGDLGEMKVCLREDADAAHHDYSELQIMGKQVILRNLLEEFSYRFS